eukprot:g46977.t1
MLRMNIVISFGTNNTMTCSFNMITYSVIITRVMSCAPTIAVGEIHVAQRYDKILKRFCRVRSFPVLGNCAFHSGYFTCPSSIVPRLVRSFCLPNRLFHRSAANSFTKVLRKSSSQESDNNNDKNLKCLSYMTDVFRVVRNFAIH